ncbi:MAG: GlsB/YeaQ/YmgE family stress response membrane protein [Alphaproteobacteria bacterium]|nr:GlsB/YeaQ/YmgE family stress response membrane protein [Alphaproteobacteria bacterium]
MELGGGVHFWGTVLIGILAGWLAHKVMGGRGGLIWNLIIGLVGSWIGFFAAGKLGLQLGEIFHGWFWGNLIVSAAGAIVLLFVLRVLRGR